MTETELIMTIKFDQTTFSILSPNPTVAAKIVLSMDLSS